MSVGRAVIYLCLIVYAVIVIYPMFWTLMSSFKTTGEFYKSVWALPESLHFENFVNAWKRAKLGWNILNSVFVVAASLVLTDILAAMLAYITSRYKFKGAGVLSTVFILGMFMPLVMGTIPQFLNLQKLGLYDTHLGLILIYTAYSLPFSVLIMRNTFETMPMDFMEAAKIDGATHTQTFFKIMLPLARSGLITISIFHFLWTWNDYIYAMTFIPSEAKRTLTVGLNQLTATAQYSADWGALFAGLVIVMIPSILIYSIFSQELQAGMNAGGIKG